MAKPLDARGVGGVPCGGGVSERAQHIAPVHSHRTSSGDAGVCRRTGAIDVASTSGTKSRTAEEFNL
ncbi:MAG: hypothetical protein WA485_17185 [Candidatus Sulfotelmatobacter sp.]